MATLCTGNSYELSQCSSVSQSNKDYLYVKLTDSALRAIEEYIKNQVSLQKSSCSLYFFLEVYISLSLVLRVHVWWTLSLARVKTSICAIVSGTFSPFLRHLLLTRVSLGSFNDSWWPTRVTISRNFERSPCDFFSLTYLATKKKLHGVREVYVKGNQSQTYLLKCWWKIICWNLPACVRVPSSTYKCVNVLCSDYLYTFM